MAVYIVIDKNVFVTDQTPCPYLTGVSPPSFDTEWSNVLISAKPLMTEEIWPGRGLNPGLPNDTPALYPLLHELIPHEPDLLHSSFVSGCP
jgi:hypothetical protein